MIIYMQRGFLPVFLVVLLSVILLSFGLLSVLKATSSKDQINSDSQTQAGQLPLVSKNITKPNIYSNSKLGVEFSYSSDFSAIEDSEEEFNKRGKGDFRKNFTYYITYPPADILGAIVLLDESESYEMSPFTVWVFANSKNYSIEKWYERYWYYPFVWGDYTLRRTDVAPVSEATVSGILAKSGIVNYQPGKPKFIYINYKGKMYLFRIIGEEGDKILESFKFL